MVVTTLSQDRIDVYSFVMDLSGIKEKQGKVSSENADYVKEVNARVLGECGKHLKCVGDGAVVVTYSTKLKEELEKQENCKAMAKVLQVCNQHGYQVSCGTPLLRIIQETGNRIHARSFKFTDTYTMASLSKVLVIY